MKKELLISAKIDSSDFDRSVETMQKKLATISSGPGSSNALNTQQRMSGMGFGNAPTQEAFQRASQQSRRELDQAIASQAREQEKLTKTMSKRLDVLKELQVMQKLSTAGSEQELKIKREIGKVEEENLRSREAYKQRDISLNKLMDARQNASPSGMARVMNAYNNGGIGGAMTAGGRELSGMGMGGMLGMAGSAIGAVGGLMYGGANIYRNFAGMGMRTEQSQGAATANTQGVDVGNIYGNRSAFEGIYSPERAKAAQLSTALMKATRSSDKVGLAGGLLGNIGAGAALGAGGGALFGGVGAVPGAIGGAAFGLAKGLYGIGSDDRKGALAMSGVSSTAKDRYESLLREKMTSDYQSTLEAEKQKNPYKVAAQKDFEQNFQRNLGAQRGMGLSDEGLYGANGVMRSNINAGFTSGLGVEMSNSILGAGGSSRSAAGNSAFGNQMSRNFNLTNAGSVLGSISGGVGSASATQQATVKILAEGMKLGLDDSKFAEENRRFTQAAAEVISKSGATSGSDFERIAGSFSKFQADKTVAGVSAGQSAYEQYQQRTSEASGPRGTMRAAGIMRDQDLKKLSTPNLQSLMQVPENQLTENNPTVQAAAIQAGISPKDVISKLMKVNDQTQSRFTGSDKARDRIRDYVSKGNTIDYDNLANNPKEIASALSTMVGFQGAEYGAGNSRVSKSTLQGMVGGQAPMQGPGSGEAAVNAQLSGTTGRAGDEIMSGMATDSGTVLKNFNELSPTLVESAKNLRNLTDALRELNAQAIKHAEDGTAATTSGGSKAGNFLKNTFGLNFSGATLPQSQGGKPSK